MRIVVTGAGGFVGMALVTQLAGRGHTVLAASRGPLPAALAGLATPVLLPDLRSLAEPPPPFFDGTDAVVHAAGLAHLPNGGDAAELHRVNAIGAERLAHAAARAGASRFVLISSLRAITGPSASLPLRESQPPAPSDSYGRSKLAAETLVAAAFPGAVILRPPVIHGAGAKANMARLARLADLRLPLPIGSIRGRRSILSDINLAAATDFVLSQAGATGRCFHLSDGPPLSVPEIIGSMRSAMARAPGIIPLPAGVTRLALQRLAPGSLEQLMGDLVVDDSALRELGWRPVETSAEGLGRLIRQASRHTRL